MFASLFRAVSATPPSPSESVEVCWNSPFRATLDAELFFVTHACSPDRDDI